MAQLLTTGRTILANTIDENRRSALHFSAAVGSVDCTNLLIQAGAEVDIPDLEGYTPLHMAAGYMHVGTVKTLLEAGADPEQKDRAGRSPLDLVERLRDGMSAANNPALLAKRMACEDVYKYLSENLFEDVYPQVVLEAREVEGRKEFLVQFETDPAEPAEPVWVPLKHMSPEVVEDFEKNLEYAYAAKLLDKRTTKQGPDEYLVEWSDGAPTSWEPRSHVTEDLVIMFEAEQRGEDAMSAWRTWFEKNSAEQDMASAAEAPGLGLPDLATL